MSRFSVILIVLFFVLGIYGGSAVKYELIKDGNTCLIVDTNAVLSVAYFNTSGHVLVATMTPAEASAVSGVCDFNSTGSSEASMNITLPDYQLLLNFVKKDSLATLASITVSVNVQNGNLFFNPNATGLRTLTVSPDLQLSPDTEYFACSSAIQIPFAGTPAGSGFRLTDTKLQAFNVQNSSFSNKFTACAQDLTTAESSHASGTTAVTTEATTASDGPSTATTTTAMAPTTTTSAPSEPALLNITYQDPSTNNSCLRMQLRATFTILYDVSPSGNATARIPLPADTRVIGGSCGNSSQTVRLGFLSNWQTEFRFTKQGDAAFSLSALQLWYQLSPSSLFPNATRPGQSMSALGNQTYFSVSVSGGYFSCSSRQDYRLDSRVAMETSDLRAQAFRNDSSGGAGAITGTPVYCPDDATIDNVVPIVVGAALAGLVIVVLIAYLIGRRRHSSGGGYQSV